MSINQDLGNGGRHIVPSVRKSIHHHDRCPFASSEDMGRYGDDNSTDDEQPERPDPGVDEVDNVMSKLSHSSSPLAMRRSSMTPPNPQYTDDSEEHDDFAWRIQSPISKQLNKSGSVSPPSRGNRSGDSRNSSFATLSPNVSHIINQTRDDEKKSSGIFYFIIGLLAALFAVYLNFIAPLENQQAKYDEAKFHNDLNELGAKYNIGDDSILRLQTGISTIFKQEDTSCVIFLYNSMRNDFEPSMFDGFVNNVASNAAKFLRNDTTSVEHVVVEGSDLTMVSHTQLVKAYREDVAKTGVLLIRDVEHVPGTLAMAFHYYCDEYNPLVKKSAIFFTLNTAKCHNSGEKSSHASVESCLKKKWDTVPKDNIGPLLTRVVSIVVDVTNGV